jgi:hypothetical protein
MIKLCFALSLAASPAFAADGAKARAKRGVAASEDKKTVMEWKGNGGPGAPGHEVIADAENWAALWRRLNRPAPALDFKTHAAVVVFLGEKPTGGWGVQFSETRTKKGDLIVAYRAPAPTGFVTQAFTTPWAVKAFAKPKGKVVVEAPAP